MLDRLYALFAEIVGPNTCAACPAGVAGDALFCPACEVTVLPPAGTSGERAVVAYGGAASLAVIAMKYAGRVDLAPRLGAAMARVAAPLRGAIDVVVPVPLHPRRLAERGFDQAALLATPVARALGVPRRARALERLRDTPRQASLDRSARAANVVDAFRARPGIAGLRVLLVDDVRTTGATLAAATLALREAGANGVVTLVFASKDRGQTEG